MTTKAAVLLSGLLGSALVLLLALMGLLRELSNAQTWVSHTYEAHITAEELFGALRDAETGQRGYLLTSEVSYLVPYEAGKIQAPLVLAALGRMVADDPTQTPRVAAIGRLVGEKLRELTATVEAKARGASDDALELVRTGSGQNLMDEIRAEIARIFATENALLVERTARSKRILSLAIWTGGLAAATLAGLGVMLYRNVSNQVKELEAAVAERTQHMRVVSAELAHRTKNQLALVQAIAKQTARHTPRMSEFLDKFGERLQALSRSTSELTRHQWRNASLSDLFAAQIDWLPPTIARARISASGPVVALSPTATHYLGLAFHELATNAMKYGALSTQAGHIAVDWTTEAASGEAATFRLVWSETGGPKIAGSPARGTLGFGSTILERLTAASLSGEACSEYRPAGFVWTLTAPLASVVSRSIEAEAHLPEIAANADRALAAS